MIVEAAEKFLLLMLARPNVQNVLWKTTNMRPQNFLAYYSHVPNDIRAEIMHMATRETAEFVLENLPDLEGLSDAFHVLDVAFENASVDGIFLEFGVYSGATINHIADKTAKSVHGFDSFEGLPESWGPVPAGTFYKKGGLPDVRKNVILHVGFFDKTLPEFLSNHIEPVAFVHIDSDLYSSAHTILWAIRERIVTGTVIVFDEYFNYPNWKLHEHRAFEEFCTEFNIKFDYLAYATRGYSLAVIIR